MNPHKTMNGDMAQEGIVLRSPIGAAVRRIACTANGADSDLLIQQPVAGQSRDVGTGRHSTGRRWEWHGVRRILKRTVINAYCYGLIPAKAVSLIFKLFDLKHQ